MNSRTEGSSPKDPDRFTFECASKATFFFEQVSHEDVLRSLTLKHNRVQFSFYVKITKDYRPDGGGCPFPGPLAGYRKRGAFAGDIATPDSARYESGHVTALGFCMTKPSKYREVPSWFFYLFLTAAFHTITAGWAHAQPVSFFTHEKFSAGSGAVSPSVGDFNQDGNRDLAVANELSNNVSILLGNGNGTFQPAVNFPVGGSANSVAVSYFNGDSIQDLAVGISDSSTSAIRTVSVLLGNGNGTFRAAMSFPAVGSPTALRNFITFGDFNNDGRQDVGVPGALLLGNGDGTLRAPLNAPFVGPSVAVGYFNDDGILDIASLAPISSRIQVHIGNGDGTFRSPILSPGALLPASLATGYFNRDAIADLVVTDADFGGLNVLLGNGDGTFRSGGPSGLLLGSVAVDDFNGDGIDDLANFALDEVTVALGRGDGSFRPLFISTAVSGSSFAVGEFNSDGHKDLAVTDSDGVSILLGWGDGTFRGSWNYDLETGPRPINFFSRPTVTLGEFNRDGIQDLAVAIPASPGKISVYLGNGDGSFRWLYDFEAPGANSLAVGEFNGDRIQDVVAASSGSIAVFLGNGNGFFQPARSFGSADGPFVVGDLNADGFQDLAVVSQSASRISVFLGNGDGTLRAPMLFDTGAPVRSPEIRSVALGDFNSDGSQDLVATNGSARSVSVLLGNGNGTFRAPLIFATEGVHVSVAVGDFNRDRLQDLAVTGSFPGTSLLLGNGDGTFRTPSPIGMINGNALVGEAFATGDFNSDGIHDLVVTGFRTSVLLGNGNATFQPAVNLLATTGYSLAIGDLNGDGRPDIAVVGHDEVFLRRFNTLSVLINNTPYSAFVSSRPRGIGFQP